MYLSPSTPPSKRNATPNKLVAPAAIPRPAAEPVSSSRTQFCGMAMNRKPVLAPSMARKKMR